MSVTGDATGSTVLVLPAEKVLDQVHAALAGGAVKLKDVKAAIKVDDIGRAYSGDAKLSEDFPDWVAGFTKKAVQEALDGATVDK